MKRHLFSALAFFGLAAAGFAAENVIAEWDFAKESLTSGKYTLLLRGGAKFVADAERGKALAPCPGTPNPKGDGLTLKGNPVPALAPVGGFEWQFGIRWKMPEAPPAKAYAMILLDAAYASKSGVTALLNITPRKECQFRLNIGTGDKFQTVVAVAPMLGDGSWHNIAVRYEDGDFSIKIDGQMLQLFTPEKPMAPVKVRFSVGDRVAAGYLPFTGLIDKVKVIGL